MPVSEVAGLPWRHVCCFCCFVPRPIGSGSLCRTLLNFRFKRKILLNGNGHLIYEDRLHQTKNKPLCQRLLSCSRRCAATTPFVPILLRVPSARGRESKTLTFGLVSGLSGWSIPWFPLESGLSILRSDPTFEFNQKWLPRDLWHKWFFLLKTTFSWSFATLNTPHTSKKSLRKSKAKIGCSIRQRWRSAGKAFITLSLFLRRPFLFLSSRAARWIAQAFSVDTLKHIKAKSKIEASLRLRVYRKSRSALAVIY